MQRPIVTMPQDLLRQINVSWDIDWRGQSGGETGGGATQVVYNAFPRWVGAPQAVLVGSEILAWRAIRMQAQGLLGIYQVPMTDPLGHGEIGDPVLFSTGQTFDTGQGFANEPVVVAAAAASAGATTITVTSDVAPSVGQIMGSGYWPFGVVHVDETAASTYELQIQMPLRAAIDAGSILRWQGVGLFELTDPANGRPGYGVPRVSEITLGFREVLNR